jgi:hypothetical protein
MNLQALTNRWVELSQLGIVLMSSVGGLLLPPPAGFVADSAAWPKLAQFVVTIMSGLVLVVAQKRRRKRDANIWVGTALGALGIALCGLFGHRLLIDALTCRYYTEVRIAGSALTAHAAAYLHTHPVATCEDLLKAFAGHADQIWTRRSLSRAQLMLALSYISVVPPFAVCAIATLQAMQCSRPEARAKQTA